MIHETTRDFRIRYNLSQSGLNRTRMNEPYEEDSYKIAYPTNRLIKKVILPKNYDISGKEYWEVIIGDGSSIAIGEYNRIKKEEDKDFKVTYSEEGNRILKLTVDKPEIGLSYGLKWIPPTKEEYEKILEESKGVGLDAERTNSQ